MTNLSDVERQAIAEIQQKFDQLSTAAKAEVAKGVSWVERHVGKVIAITAVAFLLIGLSADVIIATL